MVFKPSALMDADDFTWDSSVFFTELNKIRFEFNSTRKLNQIKILMSGLPATGKTTTAKRLSEFFNLPLLVEEKIIKFWLNNKLNDFDK